MSDEPADHTILISNTGPNMTTKVDRVYYKDYQKFDHLPAQIRSDMTREEHDAWWKWKKAQK